MSNCYILIIDMYRNLIYSWQLYFYTEIMLPYTEFYSAYEEQIRLTDKGKLKN